MIWTEGTMAALPLNGASQAKLNQGDADGYKMNLLVSSVYAEILKWQTAAYSCSYVWNTKLFPTPNGLIDSMARMGFHLNLWEHAFTSPQSPLFAPLKDKAGDYLVWDGLVPDFADPAARAIFAGYHQQTFVEHGIAAFKLDECDNSNLAEGHSTWSFPELSHFPSGLSGEQMHQVFGCFTKRQCMRFFAN